MALTVSSYAETFNKPYLQFVADAEKIGASISDSKGRISWYKNSPYYDSNYNILGVSIQSISQAIKGWFGYVVDEPAASICAVNWTKSLKKYHTMDQKHDEIFLIAQLAFAQQSSLNAIHCRSNKAQNTNSFETNVSINYKFAELSIQNFREAKKAKSYSTYRREAETISDALKYPGAKLSWDSEGIPSFDPNYSILSIIPLQGIIRFFKNICGYASNREASSKHALTWAQSFKDALKNDRSFQIHPNDYETFANVVQVFLQQQKLYECTLTTKVMKTPASENYENAKIILANTIRREKERDQQILQRELKTTAQSDSKKTPSPDADPPETESQILRNEQDELELRILLHDLSNPNDPLHSVHMLEDDTQSSDQFQQKKKMTETTPLLSSLKSPPSIKASYDSSACGVSADYLTSE